MPTPPPPPPEAETVWCGPRRWPPDQRGLHRRVPLGRGRRGAACVPSMHPWGGLSTHMCVHKVTTGGQQSRRESVHDWSAVLRAYRDLVSSPSISQHLRYDASPTSSGGQAAALRGSRSYNGRCLVGTRLALLRHGPAAGGKEETDWPPPPTGQPSSSLGPEVKGQRGNDGKASEG